MHCPALRTMAGTASRCASPPGAAPCSVGNDALCVSSSSDARRAADCRWASRCSAASAAKWSRRSIRFWKLRQTAEASHNV